MADAENLINALSDKELVIRIDLKQDIRLIKFKIGSMDINGELGISFKSISKNADAETEPAMIAEEYITVPEDDEKQLLEEPIEEITE
ncbi:hypothetical protein [Methanococcus voltae]|uniref:Uncharacterized protein n=1 Tax=Methanococcus voltae (strain ATCC BAA-1334 / A3) TaxID=456320 RepID=D7DR55_METV3|nr:hypothetical protein [Methanococcus voltae]MCS3900992.1 hypothetical protein [Methanococcus voltae]